MGIERRLEIDEEAMFRVLESTAYGIVERFKQELSNEFADIPEGSIIATTIDVTLKRKYYDGADKRLVNLSLK